MAGLLAVAALRLAQQDKQICPSDDEAEDNDAGRDSTNDGAITEEVEPEVQDHVVDEHGEADPGDHLRDPLAGSLPIRPQIEDREQSRWDRQRMDKTQIDHSDDVVRHDVPTS